MRGSKRSVNRTRINNHAPVAGGVLSGVGIRDWQGQRHGVHLASPWHSVTRKIEVMVPKKMSYWSDAALRTGVLLELTMVAR